jgi:hypothetical protein
MIIHCLFNLLPVTSKKTGAADGKTKTVKTKFLTHESPLFFVSSLVRLLLPHCTRRGILLHLITLRHTHSVRLLYTRDRPFRRELYLTTHNIYEGQNSRPPAEFGTSIPASERQQDPRLRPHRHWYRNLHC